VAAALTAALERRGMQVHREVGDADSAMPADRLKPNLVMMNLMQMPGQAGTVNWLRASGQLLRTPLFVHTAAVDPAHLPHLVDGQRVPFLAERSTGAVVEDRIIDLLAETGTGQTVPGPARASAPAGLPSAGANTR